VWRQLAKTEPYEAIIAHDTRAGFFESGERHVVRVLDLVERVKPRHEPRRALDFGCGVGRVLIPLARRCDEAVGVDVSPDMLAEARRNCDENGFPNVDLVGDLGSLSSGPRFDLVHSYIVLQHVPERRGLSILAELVDMLADDGVGAIHVQYARDASIARRSAQWLRLHVPLVHNVGNLAQRRPARSPLVEMNTYDLGKVMQLLQGRGCGDVLLQFTTTETGGYSGVMIVFVKRPRRPRAETSWAER
jgi:trans-aconitate methyltransferase